MKTGSRFSTALGATQLPEHDDFLSNIETLRAQGAAVGILVNPVTQPVPPAALPREVLLAPLDALTAVDDRGGKITELHIRRLNPRTRLLFDPRWLGCIARIGADRTSGRGLSRRGILHLAGF